MNRPPSILRTAAAAHARAGDSDEWTRGRDRQVVQSPARVRFLTRGEGTPDIFVHMETLRRYGIAELKPGERVFVRFGDGSRV